MTATGYFGPFRVIAHLPAGTVRFEQPFEGVSALVYSQAVERVAQGRTWLLDQVPDGATLLDLCCGSGRYALLFAEAGWSCVGIDVSTAMLERARRRLTAVASQAADRVELLAADAREVRLGRSFDCVLIGGLSLTLFEHKDRRRILQTAREHLGPDGVLLLDYSPRQAGQPDRENVIGLPLRTATGSGFALVGWSRSDRSGRQRTNVYTELIDPAGTSERYLSSLDFQVFDPAEVDAELAAEGFVPKDCLDITAPSLTGATPGYRFASYRVTQ